VGQNLRGLAIGFGSDYGLVICLLGGVSEGIEIAFETVEISSDYNFGSGGCGYDYRDGLDGVCPWEKVNGSYEEAADHLPEEAARRFRGADNLTCLAIC
jgi:hypothetical protein